MFGNRDDRTAGVADAVVADRSGEVVAASDRFTGPDDQQVGVGTEAHQDIADVSLGELETTPWEPVSSNTRCIPRQYGSAISCFGTHSRVPELTAEALSPIGQSKTWTARRSFPVAWAYVCRPPMSGPGGCRIVQSDDDAVRDHDQARLSPDSAAGPGLATGIGGTGPTRRCTGRGCRVWSSAARPAAPRGSARRSARRFRRSPARAVAARRRCLPRPIPRPR